MPPLRRNGYGEMKFWKDHARYPLPLEREGFDETKPVVEILLVLIVMGISHMQLYLIRNLSWRWFTRDDALIIFKVAQNISEGHAVPSMGINQRNGYHPLWMLVCIPSLRWRV